MIVLTTTRVFNVVDRLASGKSDAIVKDRLFRAGW